MKEHDTELPTPHTIPPTPHASLPTAPTLPAKPGRVADLFQDDLDRILFENALIHEMRHDTPIGRTFFRFIDRQITSAAGMLVQCDREGAWAIMVRMAEMYTDHLLRRSRTEESMAELKDMMERYRREMYE
jgi:hypothetical protein